MASRKEISMEDQCKAFLKDQKEVHSAGHKWFHAEPEELAKNREKLLHSSIWLRNHDSNPEYWQVLYGDITKDGQSWTGRTALDFGSGWGGNIENLLKLAKWKTVEGYDINTNSVEYAQRYLKACGFADDRYAIYPTRGDCLNQTEDKTIDFVTSIVVLQHIAFYPVRYKILQEFFRVLAPGGLLSFQMSPNRGVAYHSRVWDVSIRGKNCNMNNPLDVIKDLTTIGFVNITYQKGPNHAGGGVWTYFKGTRPNGH